MATPKCYDCKWRREIFNSAHSRCQHPDTTAGPVAATASMGIKGNPYGIKSAWFEWPASFDPVWLENCDGFEAAEENPNE